MTADNSTCQAKQTMDLHTIALRIEEAHHQIALLVGMTTEQAGNSDFDSEETMRDVIERIFLLCRAMGRELENLAAARDAAFSFSRDMRKLDVLSAQAAQH